MSKKLKEIDEVDWIVMRVLFHAIRSGDRRPCNEARHTDIINTLVYLSRKYTSKTIHSAIDAIHAENKGETQ